MQDEESYVDAKAEGEIFNKLNAISEDDIVPVYIEDKVYYEDFGELPQIECEEEVTVQQESVLDKLSPEYLETQSNANKTSKKLEVTNTVVKSKSPRHMGGRTLDLVNSADFEQGIQE